MNINYINKKKELGLGNFVTRYSRFFKIREQVVYSLCVIQRKFCILSEYVGLKLTKLNICRDVKLYITYCFSQNISKFHTKFQ